MHVMQRALFGAGQVAIDPRLTGIRRHSLADDAWVDHLPGWLDGHAALFESLTTGIRWRSEKRPMYDRIVDVPRLLASIPSDGIAPPIIDEAAAALSDYYKLEFDHIHMAYYRGGNDSVAMHADHVRYETIVPIVSVGAPRRFVMRRAKGGQTIGFTLGWGDLLVMGGTCQTTWQHGVPKVRQADPRISIMFRDSESQRDLRFNDR